MRQPNPVKLYKMNGGWHCVQALQFDEKQARKMADWFLRVAHWYARNRKKKKK